jgi:hypothetical protein
LLEGATTPISTRLPRSAWSCSRGKGSRRKERRLQVGKLPGWWKGSMRRRDPGALTPASGR